MKTNPLRWLLPLSVAIVTIQGCAFLAPDRLGRDPSDSELRELDEFRRVRQHADPKLARTRPPAVIIPGVKGSVIKDFNRSGKVLFGTNQLWYTIDRDDDLAFDRDALAGYMDVDEPNGEATFIQRYTSLRRYDSGPILDYLFRVPFFTRGYWLGVSAYSSLRDGLQTVVGYTPDKDLFTFSYDWRLDNRVASVRLERALARYEALYLDHLKQELGAKGSNREELLGELCETLKAAGASGPDCRNVRFTLIAHSMGGLVARYFVRQLGGGPWVSKLILLGSPGLGSMDALRAVAEGEYLEEGVHFYGVERVRPIIFSSPATFQMLPRYDEAFVEVALGAQEIPAEALVPIGDGDVLD